MNPTDPRAPGDPSDEGFFDPAWLGAAGDALAQRCLGEDRSQLLLYAPRAVDTAAHDTLPVLGLWCRSHREDLATRWTDLAALVAVRLDDGAAYASRVFVWKQSRPSPRDTTLDPGEGFAADAFSCDLRARLAGLPWEGGVWAVTALVGAYASPVAHTSLAGSPPARMRRPAPPVGDGPFPTYLRTAASPPVPAEVGVLLDVARVMVLAPGVHCVLGASFRLPASYAVTTPAGTTVHDLPCAFAAPVTLVATRDDALEPFAVTVVAPCFDATPGATEITGCFTVDLFAFDGFDARPGAVRLWAFAGSLVHGPWAMQLGDEDELAPR